MGLDIGDICHPGLIRLRHIEDPVQMIGRDDGRLTTIETSFAFVANLGLYARQACQAGDLVGTTGLTELVLRNCTVC